jgi:hypothetical protein
MPSANGKAAGLFGWSMYDWSCDYSYLVGRFQAMTWSAIKSNSATTTVTLINAANPAMTTGSKVGVMWGRNAYAYEHKTPLVPGPSATINIFGDDLQPNTQYHTAAYCVDGLGNTWIGTDTLLTTGATP